MLLIFITAFAVAGCIETYEPEIPAGAGQYLVIWGEVTNVEGYQDITISRASPVNDPVKFILPGCSVEVEDDLGNVFSGEEYEFGKYRVWMDSESLSPGTSYRIHVTIPDGSEIVSSFETMPDGANLDSVYYERIAEPTNDPEVNIPGVQFYADMSGNTGGELYLRLAADATWEYHVPYPMKDYYAGTIIHMDTPDSSNMVCWKDERINNVFMVSTKDLTDNSYKKLPLHFVNNKTTRLYEGYSVEVKLHAITENAYRFWGQVRSNVEEQGGLYEQQPVPPEGNLINITNPGEKVFGYFGASSVDSKRIFVGGIRDMDIYYDSICAPEGLGRMGWREWPPSTWPVWIYYLNGTQLRIIDNVCVDCKEYGGVTVKPDFWIW